MHKRMMLGSNLLLMFILGIFAACQGFSKYVTYDQLYANGLDAYWNEEWEDCISYFEKSLENYKFIQDGVWNCSKECQPLVSSSELPWNVQYIFDKAICMEKCEKKIFGDARAITRISEDAKSVFKTREIYRYLQFAYFKGGYFAKSVAATNTYILYDPEDHMMSKNMDYYSNHENVTDDMLINYEAYPHQDAFNLGIEAYHAEDYSRAVQHFEEALVKFYDAEDKCRAMCEGEYDVGVEYQDDAISFNQQIIDHTRVVLECSIVCPSDMARVSKTSVIQNYLPKHYSYLQFAYQQLGDRTKAAECCKAYLLFHPDSDVMNANLRNVEADAKVVARQDAVTFHQRLRIQSELLKYLYQNFGIDDFDGAILNPYLHEDADANEANAQEEQSNSDAPTTEKSFTADETSSALEENDGYESMQEKTDDIIESKDLHNEMIEDLRKKRDTDHLNSDDVDMSALEGAPIGSRTVDSNKMLSIVDAASLSEAPIAEGPILFENAALLANSSQMLGPLRFALDGFTSSEECQQMIDLELSGGLSGDGYYGRKHPHTKHERFEGLSIQRSVQLVQQGKLPFHSAQLYYDLSERVRLQVKAYFKLKDELYFDYTHLVCRTALKGEEPRVDMSHPVHADNCILHEDGSCTKTAPAYTWRDYSAILYLNEGFEGGEFIMTDTTARRVKLQVKPKCGRLVSFCAGKDCLHGVKPVKRGRRCAMALWFTQDPSHDERLRKEAKSALDNLRHKQEL